MIRLNLLKNRFHSASATPEPETLGSISTLSFDATPSRGKKVLFAVAGLVVIAALVGAGAWYYFRPTPDDTIAPPTAVAKPKADTVATAKVDSSKKKDTTKVAAKDTVRAKDSAKKVEPVKVVEAPKPAPKPEPKPKIEPKPKPEPPPPPPPTPVAVPQVTAPALAGGVVNQVLNEAQTAAGSAGAPTRFEDLPAPARLSYQKFAFERILSVVRQVSAPTIRFSHVRLYSPGVVVLQGTTTDSIAMRALIQGLLAQSLVDTSLKTGANGQFAIVARLPFSASFSAGGGTSNDFAKTILQARDLAKSQNLDIGAPKGPSVQNLSGRKRAAWKLSGTGAWDSIDKWLSALLSTDCPLGLTSLVLASGPDGKLRLEAEAISYSR